MIRIQGERAVKTLQRSVVVTQFAQGIGAVASGGGMCRLQGDGAVIGRDGVLETA
jgi:hypothetical protein